MDNKFVEIESYKYSKWGYKRPIVYNGTAGETVSKLGDIMLSKEPKLIIDCKYFNRMTNKQGLEVVVISDTVLPKPIKLQNSVYLYPCFDHELDGKNVKERKNEISQIMFNQGRFIYDCWLPMDNFETDYITMRLEELSLTLSTFSILQDCKFSWQLKYEYSKYYKYKSEISEKQHLTLSELSVKLDNLPKEDSNAISRSIGWIDRSVNSDDDLSGFLYLMLAIESLCGYVQNGCKEGSSFFTLSSDKLTKSERRKIRNRCIQEKLEELYEENPQKFIEDSYFYCIGSIKRNLEAHLGKVFGRESSEYEDFFGYGNEKGLYELRSHVAHGNINTLNEMDKLEVMQNKHRMKKFALSYIWKVMDIVLGKIEREESYQCTMSFDLSNLMVSREEVAGGSKFLNELYLYRN